MSATAVMPPPTAAPVPPAFHHQHNQRAPSPALPSKMSTNPNRQSNASSSGAGSFVSSGASSFRTAPNDGSRLSLGGSSTRSRSSSVHTLNAAEKEKEKETAAATTGNSTTNTAPAPTPMEMHIVKVSVQAQTPPPLRTQTPPPTLPPPTLTESPQKISESPVKKGTGARSTSVDISRSSVSTLRPNQQQQQQAPEIPPENLLHPPQPPVTHRPTRRNTTGSAPRSSTLGPSTGAGTGTGRSRISLHSQFATAAADADDELIDDIQAHAEQIRKERQEKRLAKEKAAREKDGTEPQGVGKDRVVVGHLIDKNHVNYVLMYNMLTGIRIGVSRCQAKTPRPLTPEDFRAEHKFTFDIVGNELTPSTQYDFKFKDYAPWVFRDLRENYFHLDPSDYLVSLTEKYILSELGSPGKSGSFFYFSRDYRFIIKTIHPSEHRFLLKILPQYHHHVQQNPHTLLSRFYGLHRVKLPRGRKIHFVIMNNLFPPHRDIHETYDLKGSTVGRLYPPEKAREKGSGAVLKDVNWITGHKSIELGPEKRALLTEQLRRDAEFLQAIRVMDYSLLIGIHNMQRGNRDKLRKNTLKVFSPDLNMGRGPGGGRQALRRSTTTATAADISSHHHHLHHGGGMVGLDAKAVRKAVAEAPNPQRLGKKTIRLPTHLGSSGSERERERPAPVAMDSKEMEELNASSQGLVSDPSLAAASPTGSLPPPLLPPPPVPPKQQTQAQMNVTSKPRSESPTTLKPPSPVAGPSSSQPRLPSQTTNTNTAVNPTPALTHAPPPGPSMDSRAHFLFYQDEGGLRATSESDDAPLDTIYYLGVIDILTPWSAKKRLEGLYKGLRDDKRKISPVNPREYAERFYAFMRAVMRGGGGGEAFLVGHGGEGGVERERERVEGGVEE